MARTLLPYFNASEYGVGLEGAVNYANTLVGNLLITSFLLVLYCLAIHVWTKSDYKLGGGIFFISLGFLLAAIFAQTFTLFGQIIIFIFVVGMIAGIIISFIEG